MSLTLNQQFDATKLIQNILTSYLAEDTKLDSFLPFVLETIVHHRLLSPPSNGGAHADGTAPFHKWCVRLTSLLQSKVSGARWAGVCLIKVSAEQSYDLYLENVNAWCSALLSLLAVSYFFFFF